MANDDQDEHEQIANEQAPWLSDEAWAELRGAELDVEWGGEADDE